MSEHPALAVGVITFCAFVLGYLCALFRVSRSIRSVGDDMRRMRANSPR